jgi:O-antigen chain-terminating methyltransferase
MTHKKPIHPETLKFLFGSVGFRDIDARFFSPVSDDSRLKKMPTDETANLKDRAFFEVYNHNMELLNNILFGAQDYAVIGKK